MLIILKKPLNFSHLFIYQTYYYFKTTLPIFNHAPLLMLFCCIILSYNLFFITSLIFYNHFLILPYYFIF
jgi:hypothetical protein